jgi:hypothetical protein
MQNKECLIYNKKKSITEEVTSAVTNDDNKEQKGRIQIPPLGIQLSLSLSLSQKGCFRMVKGPCWLHNTVGGCGS